MRLEDEIKEVIISSLSLEDIKADDIKDDVQCFTVREIAASVKAFSEGTNIYDTVMTIYGARYQKVLKAKLEKLLRSYTSFADIKPDELTV